MGLDVLVRGDRANAIVGWIVALVALLTALASVATNELVWGGFAVLLAVVVALPAVATRDRAAMVPWPLLSVAAIAVASRVAGLRPEVASYVAVAALALVIVVELDVYTSIQLSRRFAVGFAVLTAMAIEAVWIVVQFFSDRWLGTGYLSTQAELQEDIVAVTVVSIAFGVVFYWYVARFDPVGPVDDPSRREESS